MSHVPRVDGRPKTLLVNVESLSDRNLDSLTRVLGILGVDYVPQTADALPISDATLGREIDYKSRLILPESSTFLVNNASPYVHRMPDNDEIVLATRELIYKFAGDTTPGVRAQGIYNHFENILRYLFGGKFEGGIAMHSEQRRRASVPRRTRDIEGVWVLKGQQDPQFGIEPWRLLEIMHAAQRDDITLNVQHQAGHAIADYLSEISVTEPCNDELV